VHPQRPPLRRPPQGTYVRRRHPLEIHRVTGRIVQDPHRDIDRGTATLFIFRCLESGRSTLTDGMQILVK
jgi:hypothetical protein